MKLQRSAHFALSSENGNWVMKVAWGARGTTGEGVDQMKKRPCWHSMTVYMYFEARHQCIVRFNIIVMHDVWHGFSNRPVLLETHFVSVQAHINVTIGFFLSLACTERLLSWKVNNNLCMHIANKSITLLTIQMHTPTVFQEEMHPYLPSRNPCKTF